VAQMERQREVRSRLELGAAMRGADGTIPRARLGRTPDTTG
jgi:hypothetical protein